MSNWLASFSSDLPQLLKGLVITLEILVVCLLLGSLIGVTTALIRVYGPRWLRSIVQVYIEVFRGTPLLVQLFVVYYGLPDVGIVLPAMLAAFLTISLNSGAYQSDYFRGAIQSVGAGQMMAARAIGMSRWAAIRHIILPQALRLVIPAWSTEPVTLIKISAVAFLIAVPDVMGQAKIIVSRNYNALPTYFSVTVIYLVLVFALTALFGLVEKRARIPGLSVEAVERW